MDGQASGGFEVEMKPEASADPAVGRFSLVKRGDARCSA